MKSLGKYVSKYLVSFVGLILMLLFINSIVFGWVFYEILANDYGDLSPQNMLEATAASVSLEGISGATSERLRDNHI